MQYITKQESNNLAGFYPSTFAYSCFFPKDSVSLLFLNSMAPWGAPMVDTEGKTFEI